MRNNKGFTIVELVVSVALLAIILVPVSNFFINSFKVQSRTQTKSSLTRVGQYVIENFKNKNYLGFDKDENANDYGFDFKDIRIKCDEDGKPKYDEDGKPTFAEENDKYKIANKVKFTEDGLEYDVEVDFINPILNDTTNADVPSEFNEEVKTDESGNISIVVTDIDYHVEVKNVGDTFVSRGKTFTATKPTIILSGVPDEDESDYFLLIENNFSERLDVGVVKNFSNNLTICIKGNKNIYFEDGAPGDGRTKDETAFKTNYNIGETVNDEGEEGNNGNTSELLLYANITVTDPRDETINDVFSVTFPIDYDYSNKGGE